MEKDKVKYHAIEVFDGYGKEVGVFPVQKADNIDIDIKCTLVNYRRNPDVTLGNITLPGNKALTVYANSMTITVNDRDNKAIEATEKDVKSLDTIVIYLTNDPFSKPIVFDMRKD